MAVDVEHLFKQFSINDVKEVERKIKNDIEKKKEDLRQMVGRRYQDIIDAADNINSMRYLSDELLTSIHKVQSNLDQMELLHSRHSASRYKSQSYGFYDQSNSNKRVLCQILDDIPSLIWKSLDDDQCLDAAFLFNLGDYIYRIAVTSKLDHRDKLLFDKNWSFISSQLDEIRQRCTDVLQRLECQDYDVTLNCICALILVKNLKAHQVLNHLLEIREKLLISIFDNAEISSRAQICTALNLIQNTVKLVDNLFVNGRQNENRIGVRQKITALNDGFVSSYFQEYLRNQSSLFFKQVPKEIKDFHHSIECATLDEKEIQSLCQAFIIKSTGFCQQKVKEYLAYFVSIDSLCTLKSSAVETLSKVDVSPSQLSTAQFWDAVFSTFLENRLEELVVEQIERALDDLKRQADSCICQLTSDSNRGNFIFDTNMYMLELPAAAPKLKHFDIPVYLKCIGVPPQLFKIITEFDNKLDHLMSQMSQFLSVNEIKAVEGVLAKSDFVWSATAQFIDKIFRKYIGSISDHSINYVPTSYVHYAKLYSGLYELCPALKSFLIKSEEEVWLNFAHFLKSSVTSLYNTFAREMLANLCDKYLPIPSVGENFWISNITEWEVFSTNEELEDGRKIESTITIPLSVSPRIFQLLDEICQKLCEVGAHVVPRETISIINAELYVRICHVYNVFLLPTGVNSTALSFELTQRQAMQAIFDLKFLELFLEFNKDLVDRQEDIERIIGEFEAQMDPFDLEGAKLHLSRNVIKLAHKCQITFGTLITHETANRLQRRFVSLKGDSTVNASGLEKHQILALCQTDYCKRFHLLPIADDTIGKSADERKLKNVAVLPKEEIRISGNGTIAPVSSFSSLYGKFSSTLFGNY